MKTELNGHNDNVALYAGIIAATAMLFLALLASEKAAAQPIPNAATAKMNTIVVSTRTDPTPR